MTAASCPTRTRRTLLVAATLVLAGLGPWGAARATATSPLPNGVVLASSTHLERGATAAPFTMTATNLTGDPVTLTVPAPGAVTAATVDAGSYDGTAWSVTLAPAATAAMSGTLAP